MSTLPECPMCDSKYTYEDQNMYICPECAHEWQNNTVIEEKIVKDSNGNILKDGDSIIIIKDLKVKGSSSNLKKGTKVKNIRLSEGEHDINCKIDGLGIMELKSEFVKKV